MPTSSEPMTAVAVLDIGLPMNNTLSFPAG